jgi:CRISPR-associated protein Cmr3
MGNESNFNEKPNKEKNISSMTIEIEPIDPLFFRDGRPFGGPGDHWADSLELPLPSTIYGALLGKYVSENYSVEELEELRKKREKIKSNLEIEFIYFIKEENTSDREYEEMKIPLFPVPLDVVKKKEEIKVLNWENNLFTNNNNSLIPIAPEGIEVEGLESNFFLREEDLKDYLDGEEELSVEKFELKTEPKIGIGLNKKRKAVEESKIYRVGFKRYEKFGDGIVEKLKIGVKFKGLNLPEKGILKLGGEGKTARYKKAETELEVLSETIRLDGEGFFKFYLTTPAIFEKGWIPDFLREEEGRWKGTLCLEKEGGEKVEVEASLKGAVIGKPLYVGGWDIVAGIPKPMFRAVPAGSVYLFEYKLPSPVEVKRVQKMLFNPSQSELSVRFKKEGFGIGILINQSQ